MFEAFPSSRPVALSPFLVAGLFAPTAVALWVIGLGIAPLDANTVRVVFQTIALIQLFLAVALSEYSIGKDGVIIDGTMRGVWLAAAAFLIAELSHLIVAQSVLAQVAFLPAIATLLQQVVTIALPEELWFRGLWMKATAAQPALAIGGASIGFGLYHLHQGVAVMVATAALGLLFAVARWYRAPIWALALAHGLMNWFNIVIVPTPTWRFSATASQSLFVFLVLGGATGIWWLSSRSRSERTS